MGGAAEMFAARFAPAIAGGGAVSIPSLTGAAGAFAALRPRARFVLIFPVPAVLPAWALAAGLFALNALELAFVVSSTAYLAHLIGIAAGAAIGLALRRREARRG